MSKDVVVEEHSVETVGRTLCFIPVRKGSRRILGKNLRLLGGKPLVCWILDTVLASGIADEIWVATDCDDMERLIYSRYTERVKVYRRSEWSARDEAPTMEVVKEFMMEMNPDDNDRFILLQATSPFTRREELQTLLSEMLKGEYDSFVSCCRLKKFRWNKDGYPQDYSFESKPRIQEYEGLLLESGAFYASGVGKIRRTGMLLPGHVQVMETRESDLIEIDNYADWKLADDYARHIGVTDDFYVEYYEVVDNMLQTYVRCMGLEQPVCTYLFQRSFPWRMEYGKWRRAGRSVDECRNELKKLLLPSIQGNRFLRMQNTADYRSEPWYESLTALSGRLVIYVYNNLQLNYLLPLINGLNRPIVLVCEPEVDEEVDVNDHVVAVELCFMDDYPVYDDILLKTSFPELYRYYNLFHLMKEVLRPEGVVVLDGCHYQEQIWGVIARKSDIPCIAIQQRWPSFMHTMFRHLPYSHYLTWGENLSEYWSEHNPEPDFIPVGYLYEVESKEKNSITFFLQAPLFICDDTYFNQLVELIGETAEKYPDELIGVREHPDYKLAVSVIEAFKKYPNIRMMSDWSLTEVFAHTRIVVSHFSSVLLESVAHECIPLVFNPTSNSSYTPNVEQLGMGMIAYDKSSFFEKLEYILKSPSIFLENILMKKSGWIYAVSENAVINAVDVLTRIAPCRCLEKMPVRKLHIGCGSCIMEGWLNTDICSYSSEVHYLDAGKSYPFLDNIFDYIYSEHLFEHLELSQAVNMLKESFRILKPGGRMRLSMPDFHFLMNLYQHPDKECNRQYLEWSYGLFGQGNLEVTEEDYPVHVINNFFHLWGHRFIHTPEYLTRMASNTGFQNIRKYPVGVSDTLAFKDIEQHLSNIPAWVNELETFAVEMEKPNREALFYNSLPDIPAVSIIVPVYNGEEYLDSCLSSLSNQSLKNMEVILVNDGSTDSSARILKKYVAEHTGSLYVEQSNGGLSAARNNGVKHAKGRYVAFLDCDDFLPQNALSSLYEKALAMDADIVAGNVSVFDNGFTSDFLCRNTDSSNVVSGEFFLWRVMNEGRYVPMVYCYLYKRMFIEQNKLHFELNILHEDELWTPIALAKAARVATVGSVTYYYRQHETSIMKTACVKKRVSSIMCIIDKLLEFIMHSGLSEESKQAIHKRIEVLKRVMNGLITLK